MTSALLAGTMNTNDAAEYLGVSVATLKRWRGQDKGPDYFRLGDRVKYRKSSLDRWLIDSEISHG